MRPWRARLRPATAALRRGTAGPALGLLATLLLFTLLSPPAFHGIYNLKTILTQSVVVGIAALGMTFIIIGGGIDLSVGSLVALATVVAALGLDWAQPFGALAPWIAGALVLAVCMAAGWINGLLSVRLGIAPFIATLGTMQILRGAAKWMAGEQTVVAPPSWWSYAMDVEPRVAWQVFAPGVWTLLALTALSIFILHGTVFGRYAFAIGSNEEAARLCGVPVRFHKLAFYTVGGLYTGLAGLFQFGTLSLGDPTAAEGFELDVIAAAVIGGASLRGGRGSPVGAVIGALLMAVLRNGCNMVGVPTFAQNIVVGAIIIGAVALDRIRYRRPDRDRSA